MIEGKVRTEKEYRALELDSSSSIKEFSLDRKKYRKRYILREKVENEDNKSTMMGSLVELLLWEKDSFDKKFYLPSVEDIPGPETNMGKFVEALYKYTEESTDEDGNLTRPFEEIAKEAYKDSGYKWTFDKVIEKFYGSNAELYYKELRTVKSKGLTVVSVQDLQNAERIVEALKNDEFIGPILALETNDRYTVLIQQQIEGYDVDGLKLKSMMD